MDNQNKIEMIKKIITLGEETRQLMSELLKNDADGRWVSIAQTHLQQGFMATERSVIKPTNF
jgi:hypothetical protein